MQLSPIPFHPAVPQPPWTTNAPRREGGDFPRMIGVTLHLARDQEVFGEGEPADRLFKVVRGAVRGFRMLADGRRQICDFYLQGDIFGLEPGDDFRTSAEAISDTVLIVTRRSIIADDRDPAIARALLGLAMSHLERGRNHALTLGRRTATERLCHFLLDLADRLGDADTLDLPMSRHDIADYLGLTIETVSRTLTQMQISGLVKLGGRRSLTLCQRQALADLCA